VIDEVFYDFALKSFDNRDKLILLKEPTIERILMPSSDIRTKNIFDVKNGKFCILVFGGISNRKGVVELLKALKNNTNDKFCVIIAGKIEKEVELFLESDLSLDLIDRNILFVFPGFKSEIEQDMLFESCDVVWVGYVNGFSSSSGVFFQSGQYSKPVLSCNNGLISFLVKKYNNGLLCNVQSWEDIILNLELLCADKNLYNLFAKNSKNMIQLHSGDIFGKKITEKIQGVVK
jgi:glycosyltransferase involved in cell wall biosynthesis